MTNREWEPRDPVNRHAARLGAKHFREDPVSHFQMTLLRSFLDILRCAMDDEGVPPDVARHVIDKVLYGGFPCDPEVEMRIKARREMNFVNPYPLD